MTAYKRMGLQKPGDAAVLLLITLGVGIAVGVVANFIGQHFRPVVLLALAMGSLVGIAGAFVVSWRRVQAPILVSVIGLAGAAAAWSTDMLIEYGRAQAAVKQQVITVIDDFLLDKERVSERIDLAARDILVQLGDRDDVVVGQVVATLLGENIDAEPGKSFSPVEAVPWSAAFTGWLRWKLDGSARTVVLRRGTETVKGQTGNFILMGVEFFLMLCVSAYLMARRAQEPLCSRCKQWYPDSPGLMPVTNPYRDSEVIQALDSEDAKSMASLVPGAGFRDAFVGLRFRNCPGCPKGPALVEVVKKSSRRGASEKILHRGLVERAAAHEIAEAVVARSQAIRDEAIRNIARSNSRP